MIVVDYIKLKKAEIGFKFEVVKYLICKQRFNRYLKKIGKVYPDSESIDKIPNKAVIAKHNFLANTNNRIARACFDKMEDCNGMRIEFLENLID